MAATEERADRQGRLSRNQSLFREVNERIDGIHDAFAPPRAPLDEWVCECANESCFERMPMTVAEYEAVRATPTHFAVVPADDHVYLDAERLVARNERYWVVEKIEAAARVAEHFDPRSRTSSHFAAD